VALLLRSSEIQPLFERFVQEVNSSSPSSLLPGKYYRGAAARRNNFYSREMLQPRRRIRQVSGRNFSRSVPVTVSLKYRYR